MIHLKGQREKAIADDSKALEINPSYREAQNNIVSLGGNREIDALYWHKADPLDVCQECTLSEVKQTPKATQIIILFVG